MEEIVTSNLLAYSLHQGPTPLNFLYIEARQGVNHSLEVNWRAQFENGTETLKSYLYPNSIKSNRVKMVSNLRVAALALIDSQDILILDQAGEVLAGFTLSVGESFNNFLLNAQVENNFLFIVERDQSAYVFV